MRVWQYADYDEYKTVQVHNNRHKLDCVFVKKETIEFVATGLKEKLGTVRSGLCHGTRNGTEIQWFKEFLNNPQILGTEISDTATQFPDTIEWDFHDVKKEWIGRYDFIYSNSLDHSYKPVECFANWMKCIRQGGYCVLHWTPEHSVTGHNGSDPFAATLGEYIDLGMRFGRVIDVNRYDSRTSSRRYAANYLIWIRACRPGHIESIPKWEPGDEGQRYFSREWVEGGSRRIKQ